MATYTQIDETKLAQILDRYDLGPVHTLAPLKGGLANSSFKLATSQGTYVLSVCDEKSMAEVTGLAQVLELLEHHNFPTTRIVPTKDGRPAIRHGGQPAFIKTYIDGAVPGKITPEMIQQVGRQLALLHQIPASEAIPRQFAYGLESFGEVIDSAQADPAYRQWLAAKRAYLQANLTCDLPRAMVHGDLFFDNTLFDGNRLVAILDFEEVCHCPRTFDLGMTLVGFCAPGDTIDLELGRALVAGYQCETPLSEIEVNQLQPMAILGAVATSFWRFRQYHLIVPDASMAAHHHQMGRFADQLEAYSATEFIAAVC